MAKPKPESHGGGVSISGSIGSIGGSVVGRDQVFASQSRAEIENALRPILDAVTASDPTLHTEIDKHVDALRNEVAKGKGANDGVVATIASRLIALVPSAASAIVSAFATPLLAGVAGPLTQVVLDRLRGK